MKPKKQRCPKCHRPITWSWDEEAGFGFVWCVATKICGWYRTL